MGIKSLIQMAVTLAILAVATGNLVISSCTQFNATLALAHCTRPNRGPSPGF